jgi:uncharacterized iron-regulated membrane protein
MSATRLPVTKQVGRIVVMLLGLAPGVMFVTGFMRWSQKRAVREVVGLQPQRETDRDPLSPRSIVTSEHTV